MTIIQENHFFLNPLRSDFIQFATYVHYTAVGIDCVYYIQYDTVQYNQAIAKTIIIICL